MTIMRRDVSTYIPALFKSSRMNIISANTSIATLIKMNKEAIDVIAGINPHFRKLKNPVLRKLLAARVSIADAARIGKCEIDIFFQRLKPLGFVVEDAMDEWLEPKTTNVTARQYSSYLDVRSDIQEGKDPFKKIMRSVKALKEYETLLLLNSFEPVPLIKILREQGYKIDVIARSPDEIYTYIYKEKKTFEIDGFGEGSDDLFEEKATYFKERMERIDVRFLPMPQPMIEILKKLEILDHGKALYVTHKRIPRFLLPELKERQYEMVYRQTKDDVRLIIYKSELSS